MQDFTEEPPIPTRLLSGVVAFEQQTATIGGKPVSPSQGVSPYVNVDPGAVSVSSGGTNATLNVEPGKYYTMTMGADGDARVQRLRQKRSSQSSALSL